MSSNSFITSSSASSASPRELFPSFNLEDVLSGLRLRLHPRKGGVHATKSTIPFLGFTLRRGCRRLQHDGLVRATRRLRQAGRLVTAGAMTVHALRSRVAAWSGHAKHASSPRVIDQVLARAGLSADLWKIETKSYWV